jgi:hypothetical protein
MRSRLSIVSLLALAFAPVADAADVKFVRVWPDYRTADSFTRVGEYFGGKEHTPELLVRSQPAARDGFYFLARVKSAEALPGAILAIETVQPGSDIPSVHFLSVDLPQGSRAVLAGLTGNDWPSAKVKPTAWRLRLLSSGGVELARQHSFLWTLPAAPAPQPASSSPAAETPAATPSAPAVAPDAPPAGT